MNVDEEDYNKDESEFWEKNLKVKRGEVEDGDIL